MTPLDTLKAGLKTAMITFLSTLVLLLVGVMTRLADSLSGSGTGPDWNALGAAALAAVVALFAGVLNTTARYLQVRGVPLLSGLVDRLLGAAPSYPEAETVKVQAPPGLPVTVEPRQDGPPPVT